MEIMAINIEKREVAEEIWALQHPAYRVEADLIGLVDLPPLRDTIQTLQACSETFWGCRDQDGELIGAASYAQEKIGHYTICRLMVHPAYMRQGIGSLLVGSMLSDQPSAATWSVTAEIRNLPAVSLYERFGFVAQTTFNPMPGIEMVNLVRPPSGK